MGRVGVLANQNNDDSVAFCQGIITNGTPTSGVSRFGTEYRKLFEQSSGLRHSVPVVLGLLQPRTRFPSDSGSLYQKSLNRVKDKKIARWRFFLSVSSLSFRRKAESGGFICNDETPREITHEKCYAFFVGPDTAG
jgi:hypothetical protein